MCKVGQTGVRRSDVPCFVGIDVAKAQWDMALRPAGERWAVPNDASGIAPLVDRLSALKRQFLRRQLDALARGEVPQGHHPRAKGGGET